MQIQTIPSFLFLSFVKDSMQESCEKKVGENVFGDFLHRFLVVKDEVADNHAAVAAADDDRDGDPR